MTWTSLSHLVSVIPSRKVHYHKINSVVIQTPDKENSLRSLSFWTFLKSRDPDATLSKPHKQSLVWFSLNSSQCLETFLYETICYQGPISVLSSAATYFFCSIIFAVFSPFTPNLHSDLQIKNTCITLLNKNLSHF